MAIDATFEKVQRIIPHTNSDNLEICVVSNYPCITRKGEFKEGDLCFYIHDDAKLVGFDEKKEFDKRYENPGDMFSQDCFHCKYPWQESLLKYLGGGGRVKTIKLRGEVSMGILLKPEVVTSKPENPYCVYSKIDEENYLGINSIIKDPTSGPIFLENNFGIVHWEPPTTNVGQMNVAYQGLPMNLKVSDEENYENLEEKDLHLGSKCIVTQKFDGSSTTVTCYPDGRHEISCRRMTFKEETDEKNMNAYQKHTQEAVRAGLWWAKKHNKVIAFRGEVCCGAFNKSSFNRDCGRNDFYVYGCNFPELKNYYEENGLYGTKYHFKTIVDECNQNGFNVKHVDILEEDVVVTRELLKKYNDRPYTDGEGAVIGIKVENTSEIPTSFCWHYKSKSREYLMKMK